MDIVSQLYAHGVVKLGKFTLKSGQVSPIYLDLRVVPSHPELFSALVRLALEKLRSLLADGVVGIATGGLVWSSVLAYTTGLPHFYVREEVKTHGTGLQVEGGNPSHLHDPVIVDDVATSGGSIAHAARALELYGLKPKKALVIVDREQGASGLLGSSGITLTSCFTLTQILDGLEGIVPAEELGGVMRWRREQKS
ncbi:MAG: phosphoribosyltransferase family protein [Thermoprotei archaeon]